MGEERSTTALDERIGHRVRARRLELGISQERLADALGVTFQQVQKYERGVNRIAASRLFDIARALDLPVCGFFEMERGDKKTKSDPRTTLDAALAEPGAVELVQIFASIKSSRTRRRVLDLVRAMIDER